ncbi:MAG: Hsp20/alpha crystallin family protein, partial [Proteobacteria bacterium]
FRDVRSFQPAYDVSETEERFLMSVDLPGMRKEDIKVEIQKDTIVLAGERRRGLNATTTESFKRSFTLPEAVATEKVEARYENGVLELYLPKSPAAKVRAVEIQTGGGSFFQTLAKSEVSESSTQETASQEGRQ